MQFIRRQEERLAVRLITWQYQRAGLPVPSTPELGRLAAGLVEEAHRIAHERGRNVLAIIKEMVRQMKT